MDKKIYINRTNVYIKSKYVKQDKELLEKISKELIIEQKGGYIVQNKSKIKLFSFNKDKSLMYLPKSWALKNIGEPLPERMINMKIKKNMKINCKDNIKLRPRQKTAVKDIIKNLKKYYGTLLSVPCGFGKTVCALKIANILKLKTIIIVHTMSLLEQWEERIKTFIPDARIGKIIQKTYDIEDKDFVIASLQTIISKNKNFNKSNFKQFGLCIYDECHHISAPSFYKCIPIISSFYTLGLSATPDRKDGLEQIFYNFIGDIGYKEDKKLYSVVPTIENIDYDNSDKITIKKLRFSDRVDFNNLIKQIIEDDERNELICNLVKECIEENDKRQILLVSHRILQIKKLYKMINKLFDKEICGLYIGGLKKEKLEESSKKQVIIATYNIMSEGVDIPTLNTLIYATPTKDIQQVSGRILRKDTGIEHKIIDIIDNISIFKNQFRSRYNFYKKHYL